MSYQTQFICLLIIIMQVCSASFFGQTNRLEKQKLEVYFIPHSHDDVGWLDTMDAIYERSPGVKKIISSYIEALLDNKNRKFVQVEIIYFERWWNEQNPSMQAKVKKLVEDGQLDFAGGGLVMHDEATPYYEDMIDQLTFGNTFLYKNFNKIPNTGWQLDPFGHSNTHTILSYLFGIDAQYYARIDYQDKQRRQQQKELELLHIPRTTSKQNYPILTHVTFNHYSSPSGFDFDAIRNTGGTVTDQNVASKANTLEKYFLQEAHYYKGNIITHTLGDDNEWSNSKYYYQNIEKVMDYINKHPEQYNITIKFGTPTSYIDAINEFSKEILYPQKNDDFFPYADRMYSYWTGYFTSKTSFKGFVKYTGRQYQQIKSFISYQLAGMDSNILTQKTQLLKSIKDLGYILGISQHHDAITGTSRDAVTKDYTKLLYKDYVNMNNNLHNLIKLLITKNLKQNNIEELYQYTYNATSQQCKEVYQNLIQNKTILLTLLDSRIQQGDIDIVKIKVPKLSLNIINQQNQFIQGDIICSNKKDDTDCTLYFNYPIYNGLQYFKIKQASETNCSASLIIGNTYTNITANSKLQLDHGPEFFLNYKYYVASNNGQQPSGAYIFRPDGKSNPYGNIENVRVYNGTIITEVNINRDTLDTWIRKYKIHDNQYEIETFVGPILKEANRGKEIVIVFHTPKIASGKTFYTDSNGLDLQERKIGFRETWSLQSNEPISENYYPVNGVIQIKDLKSNYTLAIVNDRSQGGTSLNEGEIELMLHRRMYVDDKRGLFEALDEKVENPQCNNPHDQKCEKYIGITQNIVHKLIYFDQNTNPNAARKAQLYQDFQPIQIFGIDSQDIFNQQQQEQNQQLSYLNEIKIINQTESIAKIYLIPQENEQEYLLRIHNMQDIGTIQFQMPSTISSEETIISGLRTISEQNKLRRKWNPDEQIDSPFIGSNEVGPQQIKTFKLKI